MSALPSIERLRKLSVEGREWCEDWASGAFTPAHTNDGWTVEMHGLVDSHHELCRALDALLDVVEAAQKVAELMPSMNRGISETSPLANLYVALARFTREES